MKEKQLFFDVETTGLDPVKNDIVQIAGYIYINGEQKESFNFFSKPINKRNITAGALRTMDKSREQLLKYPDSKKAYRNFISLLDKYIDKYNSKDKFQIIGHNISFDLDFLINWAQKNNDIYLGSYINYTYSFCTLSVYRALAYIGVFPKLSSY